MSMKKILTGALIGAFVFGVSVADMNLANATSLPIETNKQTADKKVSNDMKKPPESPKDANGNPLAPPDRDNKNSDNKNNPPEPPKDENGNPLAPPQDKNHYTNQQNKK